MAFEAFIPKSVTLDGDDAILEGTSYRRTFNVKKLVSGVDTPVNMTEYDAVQPTIVFKDKTTETGGVVTGCPSGVCTWTDSAGGILQLDITAADTNTGSGAASSQKFGGIYEIVVKHDTETENPSAVPKKTIIFSGTWRVQQTASAT